MAMRLWAVVDMSPHAVAKSMAPETTSHPPNDPQTVPIQTTIPNKNPHVIFENLRLPPRGM